MKEAATNFVNGLYTQNGVQQESMNNLRVSLVPFTSMVNVGKQHTNFLASGSLSWDPWGLLLGVLLVGWSAAWQEVLLEKRFMKVERELYLQLLIPLNWWGRQ